MRWQWKHERKLEENLNSTTTGNNVDQLIGQLLTVSVNTIVKDSTCISNNNNVCLLDGQAIE